VTVVTATARDLSVCVSVTLMHPAKAIGQSEMLFGRDTRMVSNKIVLDRTPVLHEKGRFGGLNPQFAAIFIHLYIRVKSS